MASIWSCVDVDGSCAKLRMHALDFCAHLLAKPRIEVGKRLSKRRLSACARSPDTWPQLALAAGKEAPSGDGPDRDRAPVFARRILTAASMTSFDSCAGAGCSSCYRDTHMRIERIGLEDLRDIPIPRLQFVDTLPSMASVPEVMSSSPAIIRNSVDFPQRMARPAR